MTDYKIYIEDNKNQFILLAYFKIPICTFYSLFQHTPVAMAVTYDTFDQVLHSLDHSILKNDKGEPADLIALCTGKISISALGQYGSTWEFVWGLLRDLPMGAWYPIVQFCEKRSSDNSYLYTTEQIVDLMATLSHPHIPFLRYVGFIEMADLFDGAMVFAPAATRAELRRFACSFLRYLNRYTSYALFYFDWKMMGENYTYDNTLPAAMPKTSASRIDKGQKIKISWSTLGFVAYAYLDTRNNPYLCTEFIQMLPFEALHIHVLVSGNMSYTWVPGVITGSVQGKQRLSDAPIGRIFFSQATGMKVMINHGHVSEDLEVPVLGDILPQYHGMSAQLESALWKSTYETKEVIMVRFELADDGLDDDTPKLKL